MKILGLDPSLNSTGFAYRAPTGAGIITGTIDPKPLRGPARLLYARTKFRQILDTVEPDLVAMEGYGFASKGHVFDMGEMGGMYRLEMFDRHIPYLLVPPSNLKMFATGYGGGKKEEKKKAMVDAATSLLGRKLSTDDEADAYHLMRMGTAWTDRRSRPRLRNHHENVALVKCEMFQR